MRTKISKSLVMLSSAAVLAVLAPQSISAQSQLDSSEAQAFMGTWVVNIDSDFGAFSMDLEVTDMSGKVGASLGAPEMGGMQPVSDITRTGEGLTLSWELDAQGQLVDATMILSPAGEGLSALFTVADGQFTAVGTATRTGS